MGKKSTPKPPDPYKVAAAQGAADRGAAEYNRLLNQVAQEGPDGSLEYVQDGFDSYIDPISKRNIQVPRYKAVTKLSMAQQGIKDATDAAKANNARIAQALSGKLSDTPLDLNTEVEDWLFNLGGKRLKPRLDDARRSAETRAANMGLVVGSDAYDRLMRGVGETENDAWNELALTGRSQAVSEALGKRKFDIDQILSLMSGAPVSSPNESFVPIAQTSTQGAPIAAAISDNYNAQLAASQQKKANFDKMLGGLFGVGAAVAGNPAVGAAIFSDRRLKTDVKKVGKTDDGQNVYAYRYKGDRRMHLGLMAQEVEKKTPEAVVNVGGYKAVDYGKALHLGAA